MIINQHCLQAAHHLVKSISVFSNIILKSHLYNYLAICQNIQSTDLLSYVAPIKTTYVLVSSKTSISILFLS